LRHFHGGGIAFDGKLTFYVVDHESTPDADSVYDVSRRTLTLWRADLDRQQSSPFADCFSPVLSPGGRWFACRNRRGDLLRVPVAGGKLQTVAVNQAQGEITYIPYAYIYPDTPVFKSATKVSFSTGDEENREVSVAWQED
jgi:hypothetical protein